MSRVFINYFPGRYEASVKSCLNNLQQDKIVDRILAKDYTVWKSSPDNIVNRLGWLTAPSDTLHKLSYIQSVIDPLIKDGFEDVVLLGMGGSSLAVCVFCKIFGKHRGFPQMHILDTTDPAAIKAIADKLKPKKILFIVSSKSGTTLETASLFQFFYNRMLLELGNQAGSHFIFITNPDSPLEELASRESIRHVFLDNPDIGGRYSALSFPGIVPAALIGIDIETFLREAVAAAKEEAVQPHDGKLHSTGFSLGTVLGTLAQAGCDKLTFLFPPSWEYFGSWLEQLIAESTGKEGKGILPVCEAGFSKQNIYGADRSFVVFYCGENHPTEVDALIAGGYPVVTIRLTDNYDLAGQMYIWEMATAVAAHILGVNPFHQPDVEATKSLTRKMIALYREKKELPQEESSLVTPGCIIYGCPPAPTPAEALHKFLIQAKDGAYICIQAYLNPIPQTDKALLELKEAIGRKYGFAVAVGYGPRYLHSTGQLHKGDAGHGLFIQVTAEEQKDLAIPDKIGAANSTITFGALKNAQALGDRQTLLELGRKVIRLHFSHNYSDSLIKIANSL